MARGKHDCHFTIFWLTEGLKGNPSSSAKVIGREHIKRHDLTAAHTTAQRLLKKQPSFCAGYVVQHVANESRGEVCEICNPK